MRNRDAMTMGEVLIRQAMDRPDKRAFAFLERGERETSSVTYAELNHRAQGIARVLEENELGGGRVILAYPSGIEFAAALFACFHAGAVAVPAPVGGHGNLLARIRTILTDADAAAVLSLRSLIPAIETPNVLSIATDEIAGSDICRRHRADPQSLALLQYTSGSTGTPRGVMLTHANLLHNQQVLARALASGADDRGVSWLPLYHDMGLMGGILHPVYQGFSCALMAPLSFMQKPIRWLKAIDRYRASISMAPCFAFALCARRYVPGPDADLDLSSWRVAICGGETIRPRVLERFAETFCPAGFDAGAFLPAYGLAEATLLATSTSGGTGVSSCGHPWEGQRIAIVDPESCRRLPPGQSGEIWLQGQSVATGYWNRSDETHATFHAALAGEPDSGCWLRTGDLGYLGPDGLVVTGRRKEILVIRGANYDPLDLETEACDSDASIAPGGAGAFTVDREDGEAIVLVAEIERSAFRSTSAELLVNNAISAVNRRFGLPIYDFVLLRPGALPRTTSGKIQRHLSKQRYLAGELDALPPVDHPALGRCRPHAEKFV